jgi:type IV secretory pathway VirB10-like protein
VSIELLDRLSSGTSMPGDRFRARVAEDVLAGGAVAIPAGAKVSGVVTEAVGLKKIGGKPKLRLEFTEVQLGSSRDEDLHATYAAAGKSETKKDAATIGGAAAGGAILGRIIGHQRDNDARGTAIGGVVGAAAGTAVAAKTKGQEIVLASGHVIDIVLDEPIRVTTRS